MGLIQVDKTLLAYIRLEYEKREKEKKELEKEKVDMTRPFWNNSWRK